MLSISLSTYLFFPGWTVFVWPTLFLSFEHRGYTKRSHMFPIPTRSQFSRDYSRFRAFCGCLVTGLAKDLNLYFLWEVHGLRFTIFFSVSCKSTKPIDVHFVSVLFRDSEKKENNHMWHFQPTTQVPWEQASTVLWDGWGCIQAGRFLAQLCHLHISLQETQVLGLVPEMSHIGSCLDILTPVDGANSESFWKFGGGGRVRPGWRK